MTHEQATNEQPTSDPIDPKGAPVAGSSPDPEDSERPLNADEGEPDVEPFAGDDDILSGHIGTDG